MDSASASSTILETWDQAIDRNVSTSMRKKRSLPNLLLPSRQTSTRSRTSPPQTAALDQAFATNNYSPTSSSYNQSVPPVPYHNPSVLQSRIIEARQKKEEQCKNVLDVSKFKGRPSSPKADTFIEQAPCPSFSRPHKLRAQTSNDNMSRPRNITTARPSYESSIRHSPRTATFPKANPIHPTQGELNSFDFKFHPRPHTANLSHVQQSPKHESLPGEKHILRPRHVSDADSSWQRSPKVSDHEFTPPWTTMYAREQRGSGASGFSTSSSTLDTQRSSVFTKASVISECTEDLDELQEDTDDILDMYFVEKEETLQSIKETLDVHDPESVRGKRRSMMIAKVMEAELDEAMSRQSSQQTGSSLVISESASNDTSIRLNNHKEHQPPRLGTKNTTHDQYGFRKATREVSIESYDAWWAEYSKYQKHRTFKWKKLLKDKKLPNVDPKCFPEPDSRTRSYVQKGIPPAWRGNAWFFYAGGHEYLERYPGRYQDLLNQAQDGKLSTLDHDAIERDLHRTFPDNLHYKPGQETPGSSPNPNDPFNREETPMLSALRRVLSAFAVDHPKIGYCQSLNFLAGMLLLFLPEERAFWLLHIIAVDILPGTHETSLEGANVDLWVLMLAIETGVPSVWSKVGVMPSETNQSGVTEFWDPRSIRLPPISLCTTSWFMSLFIGTLPTESVLRVWDLIFYEGAKTLFRVALTVFKAGENEIKAVQDSMEIFQVVQQLPRRMINSNELIDHALAKGKTYVTGRWLSKQRAIRRSFFAKERGVETARKMSKAGKKDENISRKQSRADATSDEFEDNPALGEVPQLERVSTRKASDWFVKRTRTVRKVAGPAA